MNSGLTAQDLVQFEKDIADLFNAGQIRSVIHLYSGGEENMLKAFESINPEDWVMCSWRSHYQCLLKGVPREVLKKAIVEGRSIALCFTEYQILSSGIVGGILPIAMGIAYSIKCKGRTNYVHCFLGDMTSETGIASECIKYSRNFDLPIIFHVEDNGMSICGNTKEIWGSKELSFEYGGGKVQYSRYATGKYPHAGAGKRVQF